MNLLTTLDQTNVSSSKPPNTCTLVLIQETCSLREFTSCSAVCECVLREVHNKFHISQITTLVYDFVNGSLSTTLIKWITEYYFDSWSLSDTQIISCLATTKDKGKDIRKWKDAFICSLEPYLNISLWTVVAWYHNTIPNIADQVRKGPKKRAMVPYASQKK